MARDVSNKYIKRAISELSDTFGVREPISGDIMFESVRRGRIKEAVKMIANQLDLPINVEIKNISNDYKFQGDDNRFQSRDLVEIDKQGSKSESIAAQVLIPNNLPLYGSSLEGYNIPVRVSENCSKHPKAFTMIMAHELSHILMHSIKHKEKDNEIYTDLTAMLLGFKNVFRKGRKITETDTSYTATETIKSTTTTTYGYLDDSQFRFASRTINSLLQNKRKRKEKMMNKASKLEDLLLEFENKLWKFNRFLNFLVKNTSNKISASHSKKIAEFFRPGYREEFVKLLEKNKKKVNKIKKFGHGLEDYTKFKMRKIEEYSKKIDLDLKKIKKETQSIGENIKFISKYVNFSYKVKTFFVSTIKKHKRNKG